jgi:hypothetical protein
MLPKGIKHIACFKENDSGIRRFMRDHITDTKILRCSHWLNFVFKNKESMPNFVLPRICADAIHSFNTQIVNIMKGVNY